MSDIPEKYAERHARDMEGGNRKDAVVLHCIMCMGWQPRLVRGCTATDCPLYPYRLGAPSRIDRCDSWRELARSERHCNISAQVGQDTTTQ
jgi:hypothetical protein